MKKTTVDGVEDFGREEGVYSGGCVMTWVDGLEWIRVVSKYQGGSISISGHIRGQRKGTGQGTNEI